ncbi:O-antigen ligase [Formivibrio citricus]|uniref:O-antigen ligase n=1 Tax=Formivibrio citricus TaxID=83765 RepID=A0A1I4VLZ4_9NEIS|nr:O-antigen ligase family protein [Formivibrio citricus]SFN02254.1 O-antigen ligase [Formivibrio citricus]
MDFSPSKIAASWQGKLAVAAAFLAGVGIPVSLALENIAAGLIVLAALLTPALWRQLPGICRKPFVLACLAFYGLFVLGALWSPEPLERIVWMLTKLRAYLCAPLIFAVFLLLPARRAFFWGLTLGTLASLVLSFAMAAIGKPFWQGMLNDWAVFHSHTYHNYYLSLLVFGLLALLVNGEIAGRWKPVAWVVILLCTINILFMVQGRTAQVIFLLLLALIPVLWRWRLGLAAALLGAMVLLPALYFSSAGLRTGVARVKADLALFEKDSRQSTSVGVRLNFYRSALQMVAEKPLLGHGTGTIVSEFKRIAETNPDSLETRNPHNDYLWTAVELGLAGIVALLGMMTALVIQARRSARPEKWMCIGFALSMAASTLANSFFMDNITGLGFVLTACALLAGNSFGSRPAGREIFA